MLAAFLLVSCSPPIPAVEALRSALSLDLSGLEVRLHGAGKPRHIQYGPIPDILAVEDPDDPRIDYLVQDDHVVLVLLGAPVDIDATALEEAYPNAALYDSRFGKAANHHVAAERGVSWSEERGSIHFVEVFEPCAEEIWKERFYKQPMPFIR